MSKRKKVKRESRFKGNVLVIGCGSVAQCAIPLIPKIIGVPHKNVSIIDFVDNRKRVSRFSEKGDVLHDRAHYARELFRCP